jgi:hypothetical protein
MLARHAAVRCWATRNEIQGFHSYGCNHMLVRYSFARGNSDTGPLTQATYFSYRLQRLTDVLKLTPKQKEEMIPVVEQEMSMLEEVVCDPAASRKYKLSRFDAILHQSDLSMKPILTAAQYQKLPKLREEEMQELGAKKPAPGCTLGSSWAPAD